MRAIAIFCLVPLLLSAQVAVRAGRGNPGAGGNPVMPPPPPPTPAQDLASLDGQVLNALTGQALRKADISMNMVNSGPNSPQGNHNYSASTGASHITGIEPGTYRLSANHTGFLSMQYNARRPNGPGTNLDLGRAQKMTG